MMYFEIEIPWLTYIVFTYTSIHLLYFALVCLPRNDRRRGGT